MVRGELFRKCVELMGSSSVDDGEFDTLCIFQDATGEKNPMFRPFEEVTAEQEKIITEFTEKRCSGEPLQYILGEWEFWGFPVKVGAGVLIPRPDTETLVEAVLKAVGKTKGEGLEIADLCSGSGCIAIALKKELPEASVYGVELSETALGYLRENAGLNGVELHIKRGDVLDKRTASELPLFDVIVSNPPYLTGDDMAELQREVAREPSEALYGGADGLRYYREMTEIWKGSLKKGGILCYEFGMGQHDDIKKILQENGFGEMKFDRDAGGIIRTVTAKKLST